MKQLQQIKHVFPGGNTSKGFYSFYDYIIQEEPEHVFVLKGGPGVGKSTFMRTIAQELLDRGLKVEYHHCSSDPESLDGVAFPELRIAIIDGTAPHVVDPKYPGCIDEILHLNHYLNETKLRENRAEILKLNAQSSEFFQRAYKYLAAAESVYQDWETTIKKHVSSGYINQKAVELINRIYGNREISNTEGQIRHLFASAITPDGMVNHLESLIDPMPLKIVLHGLPGTGRSRLLYKVATAGVERGLDLEMFHCALNPDRVEHLVIPDLGVAITTSEEPHAYKRCKSDIWINLNSGFREEGLEQDAEILSTVQKYYWELLGVAISYIRQAKETHDAIESLYIPSMDFDAMGELRTRVLNKIITYIT